MGKLWGVFSEYLCANYLTVLFPSQTIHYYTNGYQRTTNDDLSKTMGTPYVVCWYGSLYNAEQGGNK